jgi:hypothetical protein
MYAQPVENEHEPSLAGGTADQPSQRTLRWNRVRELGEVIVTGGDPARIVERARELVDVLCGLEEWDQGTDWMRPIPMVALNDSQVALIYSLVLLAQVQKTGSAADRPGEPRYRDVRDRWLACTAEELEEVRGLAEVWGLQAWGGRQLRLRAAREGASSPR